MIASTMTDTSSVDASPVVPRRVVAIVGRPNVGKSAVFNRIAGQRLAIVHDQIGVTRDRQVREVVWDEQCFELVDTGGLSILDGEEARDPIDAGVRAQVDAALADAAAVILVVDVQSGRHPLDEEAARLVHRCGLPAFVAANKCDTARHEAGLAEFDGLGLPVFPVAALHNRGFEPLMEAVLSALPASVNATVAHPLRVAVVGRPNAGKSSYINRLLRSDRVIVSAVPGTTRDSIEIPFAIGHGPQARHYLLIDTAGMRHLRRIDTAVERFSLLRAERSIAEADVVVLLMDAQAGPTLQDKHIASRILEHRKGCLLVMNKWDLCQAEGLTETQAEPALRATLPFLRYCPVVFLSARTGYNVRRSIEGIDLVATQTQTRLPTGLLNRALEDAVEKVKAPATGGKRLTLYYAVQTGVAPITIRIFVNHPDLATRPYREYLIRRLRERFGLEGAPLIVDLLARVRPERAPRAPGAPGEKSAPRPARAAQAQKHTSRHHGAAKAGHSAAKAKRRPAQSGQGPAKRSVR